MRWENKVRFDCLLCR